MNPFEVLGLTASASEDDIKKAHRRLVVKYHPDRNNGDNTKFMEVQQAYEQLKNMRETVVMTAKYQVVHTDLFSFNLAKVI